MNLVERYVNSSTTLLLDFFVAFRKHKRLYFLPVLGSLEPKASLDVGKEDVKNFTNIKPLTNETLTIDTFDIQVTFGGDNAIPAALDNDNKMATKDDKRTRKINDTKDLGILVLFDDSIKVNDNDNSKDTTDIIDSSDSTIDIFDALLSGTGGVKVQGNSEKADEEQNYKDARNIDVTNKNVDNLFILLLGDDTNDGIGIDYVSVNDIKLDNINDESIIESQRQNTSQIINIDNNTNVTRGTDDNEISLLDILLEGFSKDIASENNIEKLNEIEGDVGAENNVTLSVKDIDLDEIIVGNEILAFLDIEGSGEQEYINEANTNNISFIDDNLFLKSKDNSNISTDIDHSIERKEDESNLINNYTGTPNVIEKSTAAPSFDSSRINKKLNDVQANKITIFDIIFGDIDGASKPNVTTKNQKKSRVLIGGDEIELKIMKTLEKEGNISTDFLKNISVMIKNGTHEKDKDARNIQSMKNTVESTKQRNALQNQIDSELFLLFTDLTNDNQNMPTDNSNTFKDERGIDHPCEQLEHCKPDNVFNLNKNPNLYYPYDILNSASMDNTEGNNGINENENGFYPYYPNTYFPF